MSWSKTTLARSMSSIALLVLFCVSGWPVFAEDSTSTTGGVSGGFNFEAPTLTPGAPAKPLEDRSKSSAAAIAMAAAAAGQQKQACYQMMAAAEEEEDKEKKAMMRSMAMQQCAQADQTLMNAYQNKEAMKLVSGEDVPEQAKLETAQVQLGQSKVEEAQVATVTFDAAKSIGAIDIPVPGAEDVTAQRAVGASEEPAPADGDLKGPLNQFQNPVEPTDSNVKTLATIEKDAEQSDEGSLLPATLRDPSSVFSNIGTGSTANVSPSQDTVSNSPPSVEATVSDGRGGIRAVLGGVGGSSSGGEPESSKTSSFKDFLAGAFGDADAPFAVSGAAGDILSANKKKGAAKEDLPNIFEYARYRYVNLKSLKESKSKPKVGLEVKAKPLGFKQDSFLETARKLGALGS